LSTFKRILLLTAILGLVAQSAEAALPKDKSIQGFGLGMGADKAMDLLASAYPACEISKSYQPESGSNAMSGILAGYAVETGEIGNTVKKFGCNTTDMIDKLNLKLVNVESDLGQPVYEISLLRFYGDPAIDAIMPIKYQFDSIRKSLFEQYGNPSGQLRIKTSTNQPSAKIKGRKPATPANDYESYNITYVWGGKGLRAQTLTYCMEHCGDYYLTANINIVKRKSLLPKNTFYVRSIALKLVDSVLEEKQFDWSYQRLNRHSSVDDN